MDKLNLFKIFRCWWLTIQIFKNSPTKRVLQVKDPKWALCLEVLVLSPFWRKFSNFLELNYKYWLQFLVILNLASLQLTKKFLHKLILLCLLVQIFFSALKLDIFKIQPPYLYFCKKLQIHINNYFPFLTNIFNPILKFH